MTAVIIVLALLVAGLAAALVIQHDTHNRRVTHLKGCTENLRKLLDDAEARADRVERLHITLGQSHDQLVRDYDQLGTNYDDLYELWLQLDQERAGLEEFARQAGAQAAQATVEIHDAQVVDNVPLPAWEDATGMYPLPIGPERATFTEQWNLADVAELRDRFDNADQMALTGGAL